MKFSPDAFGEQLVRLFAQRVALARLLADRQQADTGLGDAEAVAGVHGTHECELHEPFGLHLGVGAGVEQDRRRRAGHRDRRGDRGTLHAGDATHAEQGRRHRGARVAGGDHRAGLAVAHGLGGADEGGILLATHPLSRIVVHADDLGRLDQVEAEAGVGIGAVEVGRPDEQDRRTGIGGEERAGDDRTRCVVAAHGVDRDGEHARSVTVERETKGGRISRRRRRRGRGTSHTNRTPCAEPWPIHSAGTGCEEACSDATRSPDGYASSTSMSSSWERPSFAFLVHVTANPAVRGLIVSGSPVRLTRASRAASRYRAASEIPSVSRDQP